MCTEGLCSWDTLPDKKPKFENYFEMYGMCYEDEDYTRTGSSVFKGSTDEDVEKAVASL